METISSEGPMPDIRILEDTALWAATKIQHLASFAMLSQKEAITLLDSMASTKIRELIETLLGEPITPERRDFVRGVAKLALGDIGEFAHLNRTMRGNLANKGVGGHTRLISGSPHDRTLDTELLETDEL